MARGPLEHAGRFWRIVFGANGRVASVEPILKPDTDFPWTVVEAPTLEAARKKAQRIYDARKKKAAKTRLHAEQRCACGRSQDRRHPDGRPMLTCSTCAERHIGYEKTYADRRARGVVGQEPRDEAARVASNLGRQRDRRAEIRLETLVEVKRLWLESTNVGRFARWLDGEISRLTKGGKAACPPLAKPS